MSDEPLPAVQLFYQAGTSDKVYNAAMVTDESGTFTVRVEWGRRGSNLNQGTKAVRATREAAQRAYDKVVREKTRKGYQEITDDVAPDDDVPPAGEGSGSRAGVGSGRERLDQAAQLLNAVDDEHAEVERLVRDDALIAQQKFDGERPVAEVRYLYATDADQLFQPVFMRLRDDKAAADCVLSQLRYTDKHAVA